MNGLRHEAETGCRDSEKLPPADIHRNIRELVLRFLPLFHRNFSAVFHKDGAYGCTKNQNKAIGIIKSNGRINPSTLGKCLDMKRGSLTTLIDSLASRGFVERQADPVDRRKCWITLTAKGDEYLKLRAGEIDAYISEIFMTVPDEEALRFSDLLEQLVGIMEKL